MLVPTDKLMQLYRTSTCFDVMLKLFKMNVVLMLFKNFFMWVNSLYVLNIVLIFFLCSISWLLLLFLWIHFFFCFLIQTKCAYVASVARAFPTTRPVSFFFPSFFEIIILIEKTFLSIFQTQMMFSCSSVKLARIL